MLALLETAVAIAVLSKNSWYRSIRRKQQDSVVESQQVIDVCLPEPNLTLAPHRSPTAVSHCSSTAAIVGPDAVLSEIVFAAGSRRHSANFRSQIAGELSSVVAFASSNTLPAVFIICLKWLVPLSMWLRYVFMFSAPNVYVLYKQISVGLVSNRDYL